MAPDRIPDPRSPFRTFLAERYSAGTDEALAWRDVAIACIAAHELSEEGRKVTLIGSLLVAGDETVFSLFGAVSSADVAAVGERTQLPYDRISEGVRMTPSGHRHRAAEALSADPTEDHR